MMDQQPRLLALTSDFVFRALFTRSLTSLTDLLNAALEFEGGQRIEAITLPPEIHKEYEADKSVILDIKARSHGGKLFNIEMQALEQRFYGARTLYYWARLYTGQLGQGENYTTLQSTYSVNFLNFNLLAVPGYQSRFLILERDHPEIQLTDKFQMVFLELPKFDRRLDELENNLELWLYINETQSDIRRDGILYIGRGGDTHHNRQESGYGGDLQGVARAVGRPRDIGY